jgi:hypothetical protein
MPTLVPILIEHANSSTDIENFALYKSLRRRAKSRALREQVTENNRRWIKRKKRHTKVKGKDKIHKIL